MQVVLSAPPPAPNPVTATFQRFVMEDHMNRNWLYYEIDLFSDNFTPKFRLPVF